MTNLRYTFLLITAAVFALGSFAAEAQTILKAGRGPAASLAYGAADPARPELFGNFGNNIIDSFRGNNVTLHLSAVALTALIVESGTDHVVHDYFNQHDEYGEWAHPVVSAARYLPFVVGGSLFAYGKLRNDDETVGASYAVLQASAIELMVNTVLKAITGRRNPDWRHVDNMDSLSRVFRFGFLRGGVYWGWPSGHTAATTAVASALIGFYPHSTVVQAAGYTLIAYIMFGVTANGRGGMHWFSDAVAGALMSYAVGTTVGKYYRTLIDRRSVQPPPILPVSTAELMPVGIRISLPL